jgi:hypothetical protein
MKNFAAIAILGLWSWNAQATSCRNDTSMTAPLVAQSTITVGTVTVSIDTVNLNVTFTTIPDWQIGRADVAVATSLAGIPQSGGKPDLSQFPYRKTFSPEVTTYTFMIPLGTTFTTGTTVFVAAHASVDSATQGHKQAWGAGQLFPCSMACAPAGGCDDDDHGDHGDRAGGSRVGDGGGGDDHCGHGDHGDARRSLARILNDSGQCGGGEDHHGDHGDRNGSSPQWGGGGGGGDDQNGCGTDDHHDHGDHHGSSLHDGGGDGDHHDDGDDDDGGGDCKAGCGATYFTYVVPACITIGE